MKEHLKISFLQTNIFWQNRDKNLTHFSKLISTISKTDIILLPEMFNTGFVPSSTYLAEKMNGKTITWMKEVSKQKQCAISGTILFEENKKLYNRLIWISKKGNVFTYDKRHLFSWAQENFFLNKGNKRLIVEENGWKICPLICYDLRFPVFSRNDANYDLLIYLANWPTKRIDAWNTLLKARAIENQSYTIGVNRIGEDGEGIFFNGNSKALGPLGDQLISCDINKEKILEIEISREFLKKTRKKMNFLKDRDNFILQ